MTTTTNNHSNDRNQLHTNNNNANSPERTSHTTHTMNTSSIYGKLIQLLHFITTMIRLLLWPVRQFLSFALYQLPGNDPSLDGLSPTVTAKAAQQFVQQVVLLVSSSTQQQSLASASFWQTLGFNALQQQATQEGKLVLVYLHAPLHRQANHVLQQFAAHAPVLQQHQQNEQQPILALGVSVHTALGTHLQHSLQVTALPALIVLQPTRPMQLLVRVQGPALVQYCQSTQTIQPLLLLLQTAVQRHQTVLAEQMARQWQRQEETALRQQQDEEYQAALAADQERERQLQQARREQEELERQEQLVLQEKELRLQKARDCIRPEPESNSTTPTANVRLVLPSGQKINRRFHSDDTVGTIRSFLTVYFHDNKIAIQNVRLSTNFPKEHYDEDAVSLQEAGLVPQAVLMVQDLDA